MDPPPSAGAALTPAWALPPLSGIVPSALSPAHVLPGSAHPVASGLNCRGWEGEGAFSSILTHK